MKEAFKEAMRRQYPQDIWPLVMDWQVTMLARAFAAGCRAEAERLAGQEPGEPSVDEMVGPDWQADETWRWW